MSDKDSSDEEDVFECGRCREKFTDIVIFMHHKKEKSCLKVKKQKDTSTKETSQDLGDVLDGILRTSAETHLVSPLRDPEGSRNLTSVSPTISELFTSKAGDKEIDPASLGLDILSSLEPPNKHDCMLCQEWLPDQQSLDNHLQERHGIARLAVDSPSEIQPVRSQVDEAKVNKIAPTGELSDRPRRRPRPELACDVCEMKFLSRFKMEQHLASRKHRLAMKQQSNSDETTETQKRGRGRPAKKGTCAVCGATTKSVKDLHDHYKENHKTPAGQKSSNHGGKKTFTEEGSNLCRECGALVPTRSLKRHERRCANRKRFECPLCKHQSRERTDYQSHIENHKVWLKTDKAKAQDEVDIYSNVPNDRRLQKNEVENVKLDVINDKEDNVIFSPSDLAVLGLMPKPQAKFTMVEECLDVLATEFKGTYDEQSCSEKELQNEAQHDTDALNDNGESSSVKLNSNQLKCKVCKNWFIRKSLSKHMSEKHGMTKQFQCRNLDCMEVFSAIESFTVHVASHSEKLMFQCGCRQCLPNKKSVDEQYAEGMRKWKMRQYYAQLSFKCTVCWMRFPNAARLRRHQQSNPHQHVCDQCGKVVVSKRQLRLHKESHKDQRGYLCDMCGSGFKTDRDLKRHLASHIAEKPFVCKECNKAFLFKNKLTRHQKTVHATLKPYKCEHEGCKKAFARKDKLHDHQNTHKAPSHMCQYCPKTFYRKDILKEHEILSHTKAFPYQCSTCAKGFLRPKGLENHQATEHNKIMTTTAIDNLLKASASVQQRAQNPPATTAASLNYVIYDQNITSVLQGATDADAASLQLQPMTFSQATSGEAPSGGDLSYQMTDITGAGGSGLSYQMSAGSLPDASNTLQVSLSHTLADPDHVIFSLKYKGEEKGDV